jgi:putative flavoprotein involved in K+ transport
MRVHTVVIGGGQAGLATSACLTMHGIEHVVLERGRVANAWHNERWDSLRLLSPNWMTRLPGHRYRGDDPNGFMRGSEFAEVLDDYAASIAAPVYEHTAVRSVRWRGECFEVATNHGSWTADAVVVATGANIRPFVPAAAAGLHADVAQFTTVDYKRPAQLPDGNVLVVGASASGTQLASELQAAGRDVTLAVGRHARLPRRYRGGDGFAWLEHAGVLSDRSSSLHDRDAARRQPSIQLVGSTPPRDLDLATLQRQGVRLTGRLVGIDGTSVAFADDLRANVDEADSKLRALLSRVDAVADVLGAPPGEPPEAVDVPATPDRLDLGAERITSVVWATGFRRSYPWLHVPVLDRQGEIRQRDGVADFPGLYTIGLRFQRVRKSNFIDGVGDDARFIALHVAGCGRAHAAA